MIRSVGTAIRIIPLRATWVNTPLSNPANGVLGEGQKVLGTRRKFETRCIINKSRKLKRTHGAAENRVFQLIAVLIEFNFLQSL